MEKSIEFVCDRVIDKKTKRKDAAGRTEASYATTVKCNSLESNEKGKPLHKLNIITDTPIEPGDGIILSFSSKQTKLGDEESLDQTVKEVYPPAAEPKKRSHHKKKEA